MTERYLDQQRRRLPAQVFKRLHRNEWSSPDSPFVEEWQVARCTTGSENRAGREAAGAYCLTCDLGLTKDRAAAAVLHRDARAGVVVLDTLRVWEGTPQRPVEIADVQATLEELHGRFRPRECVFDAWEMRAFIQAHRSWRIVEFSFSGKAMYEMATILYSLVANATLVLYPEAGRFTGRDGMEHDLQHELVNLVLVETPSGFKFDHRVGRHNDMSVAVGMGAWSLMRAAGGGMGWEELYAVERMLGVKTDWELRALDEGEGTVVVAGPDGRPVVRELRRGVAAGMDASGRIVQGSLGSLDRL